MSLCVCCSSSSSSVDTMSSYIPVHVGDVLPSNHHSDRGHEHKFWSSYKTAHTFEMFSSVVALATIERTRTSSTSALAERGERRAEVLQVSGEGTNASDVLLASSGGSLHVYNIQKMKLIRSLSKGTLHHRSVCVVSCVVKI